MSSSFRSSDGDWICGDPECANLNFARRAACNRCGKDKVESSSKSKKQIGVEIGKAAAEKSRGLFSADDWQCTKCGNVNWARRQSCNMCNAPKFGEVEERTGLAGGYNDRGVVEYIEREDSDDDYDEFGRKKKRLRRTSKSEDSSSPTKPEHAVPSNITEKSNDIMVKKSTEKEIPLQLKKESEKEEKTKRSDEEEEDEEEEDDDDDDGDLSKYDLSGFGDEDSNDSDKKHENDEKKRAE